MRSRLRLLLAALAGCLVAVLALTACDTHVGDAARVGDNSIGESQVMQYITVRGTPFTENGQYVEPKPLVVTLLVRQALAERLLAATPQGVPGEGDLQQAERQVLQQSNQTLDDLTSQYTSHGFTASAADLALRSNTLISVLSDRLGSLGQQFVQQHLPSIYVDPRYGTWDPSTLSVTGTATDQLPFLQLSGSYAPVPTSQ